MRNRDSNRQPPPGLNVPFAEIMDSLDALGEILGAQLRKIEAQGFTQREAAAIVVANSQSNAADSWTKALTQAGYPTDQEGNT